MKLLGTAFKDKARLKTYFIFALYVVAAVVLLLPVARISDPFTGKTAWLSAHELTIHGVSNDEKVPDMEFDFHILFASVVAGVIISGLSVRKASKGRLALRIITTVIGGFALLLYNCHSPRNPIFILRNYHHGCGHVSIFLF